MEGQIRLSVLTPEGEKGRFDCDSVTFFAADNENGEGGGSVGILKGHLPLIAALEDGSPVTARLDGREAVRLKVWGGFAYAADDNVTVIAMRAEDEGSKVKEDVTE